MGLGASLQKVASFFSSLGKRVACLFPSSFLHVMNVA
jgi:hypothetical protein